jgi:glycosyltransferase involved in cell wall biosynthesis
MKTMKVTLRKGYHSAFDDLVKYPPKGVQYDVPKLVTTSKSKTITAIKRKLFRLYTCVANKPHSLYVPQKDGSQLIHACSGVIPLNNVPWVLDIEHVNSFVGFQPGRHLENVSKEVEKRLASDNCKKIMPWSEAGRMSLINGLDARKFKHKMEVVYPAMEPIKKVKKIRHDKPTVLYIGSNFYEKGARELLQAYDKIKMKIDLKLIIVSNTPKEYLEKYGKEVEFHEPNIPRQRILDEFYAKSDIFVLPSYHDTFGIVYEEAMNTMTPTIATDVFAIPEILEDGGVTLKTPVSYYNDKYLFNWKSWEEFGDYIKRHQFPEFVDKLGKATLRLLEDDSARKKMAKRGREIIEHGKISLESRNKKLQRIYEEAIKN